MVVMGTISGRAGIGTIWTIGGGGCSSIPCVSATNRGSLGATEREGSQGAVDGSKKGGTLGTTDRVLWMCAVDGSEKGDTLGATERWWDREGGEMPTDVVLWVGPREGEG